MILLPNSNGGRIFIQHERTDKLQLPEEISKALAPHVQALIECEVKNLRYIQLVESGSKKSNAALITIEHRLTQKTLCHKNNIYDLFTEIRDGLCDRRQFTFRYAIMDNQSVGFSGTIPIAKL